MAVLPDINALGGLPSGLSGRVHPDYGKVVAPGRGHAEGYERLGEGYRQLGRGISNLGDGITSFGQRLEREQEAAQAKQNKLAAAQADARFLTDRLALDNELSQTGDYQEAYKFGERYQSALNNAAQYIQDPQAQAEYLTRHSESLIRSNDKIIDRANTLYKNNYIAGLNETMDGLAKAGMNTQDPTERARIIQQGGEFMDDAAKNGIIDAKDAYTRKEKFIHDFAWNSLAALPPEQRLRELGVSRPGQIAAKDMQPHETAFLNALAGPESAGKYNVRYTPNGGATFNSFADHPRIFEPGPDGPSSAAGRYQFVATTWDKVIPGQFKQGGFTPENQDHAAMWYARQVYREKTGGDLDQELIQHGVSDNVVKALGNTWRGLRDNPAKARSWYQATIQNAPDIEGSYQIASNSQSLGGLLSPDNYKKSVDGAFRELSHQNQVNAEQHRQFVSSVKQQIGDDFSSITQTGKPLENLTPDMVGNALGPERRAQFELEREIGLDYYTATNDFNSLPSAQIRQRIQSMEPAATAEGQPGFKIRQTLYNDAKKKAMSIIKLREDDPAAAVDAIPSVAAAKENVDLGGGEDAQRALVRERMKAMDAIGVPEERRVPVTRQEAKTIMAPVIDALPGQEKAALQTVIPKIVQTYGDDMASKVIGYSLNQAHIDAETQAAAGRLFKKIGMGQRVSGAEVNNISVAQTNDAMGRAASGRVPPADTAQKSYPMPPDAAIQALVAQPTPDRVQQFELTFGPGSAKRILGAAAEQTSKGGEQ